MPAQLARHRCIFFAVACLQSGAGLGALPGKIRADLIPTQLAGALFWVPVDLVSYSLIPINWIPLFINFCSLVWTVYLSLQTRKGLAASS